MKKTTTYWLLAATMTLASCASDNDFAYNNGDDNVAVTIAATRASITSTTSTPLAEGETFRLINTTRRELGRDNKYEATYKATANGIEPTDAANYVVWQTGKDITQNTFHAVIPATASYDSFTLPTDQTSADKLTAADWLTASATYNVAAMEDKPLLALNFEHQLVKIVITLTNLGHDLSSLYDLQILSSISPYHHDSTIECIVEPATYNDSPTLVHLKDITNEEYDIPLPSQITALERGKQYNFTLSGGHNLIEITSVSVTDWTTSEIVPDTEDEATRE